MLNVPLESTKNDNLMWLFFKNNNPEPCEKDIAFAVFILAVSSRCGVCFFGRARGNASVRFMLEFVVIPANSVVIILRVVVGRLRPAAVAAE